MSVVKRIQRLTRHPEYSKGILHGGVKKLGLSKKSAAGRATRKKLAGLIRSDMFHQNDRTNAHTGEQYKKGQSRRLYQKYGSLYK